MTNDEGKIRFTESQSKAISVEPPVDRIVIAMAGSGKTTVLTEYYFALLNMNNGLKPSEIVAITFTEKAARSMRVKLINKLIETGREIQSRELFSAPISTIHSFCAGVVRENSLVLGLDPDWQVLDEIQSSIMMEECLEDVMKRWRVERREIYEILMKGLSWGADPYHTFTIAYSDFRSRGFDISRLSCGPPVDNVFRDAKDNLIAAIKTFLSVIETKKNWKKLSDNEENQYALSKEILGIVSEMKIEDCTLNAAIVISGYLGKKGINRHLASDIKIHGEVLIDAITEFIGGVIFIDSFPVREAVVELISDFENAYRDMKTSELALDFDDLQDNAIKLLKEHKHVRDSARGRIKALLIDEFQDTNPVQMELVELVRPQKRFFAVGDPRQSIYGFRHADVGIMLAEIAKQSGDEPDVVELRENFRSRPRILSFVSKLFENVPIDKSLSGLMFGQIEAGRSFITLENENPVEIIINSGEDADESRELESKVIARRLTGILNEGMEIEEKGGHSRPVKPSDIAILFRKHSNMLDYSRELEKRGIPNHVVSTQGFYNQREVMDLVNFLELLINPYDALSLAEVIRASFVNITIDGLYKIIPGLKTHGASGFLRITEPFWMNESIRLDDEDSRRWINFKGIFRELLERCYSLGPSERLRAILEATHFRAASAVGRGGKRRIGNIGKLIDFASLWESTYPGDNRGFVSRMKEHRFREAREGETPVTAVENSVALMTIHAAKGLEFPVVVFADASAQGKTDYPPIMLTPDGQVLVKKRANQELSDDVKDPWLDKERKRRRAFQELEANRVLYVALTRAMEKLIISFALGKRPMGDFFSFFENNLKLKSVKDGKMKEIQIGDIEVPILRGHDILKLPTEQYEKIEKPEPDWNISIDIERVKKGPPEFSKIEMAYSVTSFSAFLICPRRMSLRYVYGLGNLERDIKPLPDQSMTEEESDEEKQSGGDDEFPVLERGTMIHKMLFEYVSKKSEFSISDFLNAHKIKIEQTRIDDFKRVLDSFTRSEIGKSIIESGEKYLERNFIFSIEGCEPFFNAIIDAVWVSNGKWRIVDYKSGKARDTEDPVHKAYEEQVRMYVRAIKAVYGVDVVEASLFYVDENIVKNINIDSSAMKKNLELVKDFVKSIQTDDFPGCKSDECAWCNYREGCMVMGT